jgi:hypothetical protein
MKAASSTVVPHRPDLSKIQTRSRFGAHEPFGVVFLIFIAIAQVCATTFA